MSKLNSFHMSKNPDMGKHQNKTETKIKVFGLVRVTLG